MPDAPRSDRRSPADSGAIEITSEPIVLAQRPGPDMEPDPGAERIPGADSAHPVGAVDITPVPGRDADAGEPAERPSSRRRKIVLGSVLAVAVAGAAVMGSAGWRVLQQKDAALAAPAEVAGLTRDESEGARSTIEYLRTAVNAEINFAESYGAVYADPAGPDRSVLLFGGTTLVWQPERDLDRLFELASEEDSPVDGIREVDAGALGGVVKCGTAPVQGGEHLVFCGWADHGSIMMGMFPARSVDESATLLRDIRSAILSRD
ncbi:hypothetical protein ACN28C_12720 [Plantactinospora sp. WMMC1484]|uniref:hypothetical protein n=1 Tax=Plantactinospora sp. WMMC1484 TaxID=3404122 RepID=UPI003BF57392